MFVFHTKCTQSLKAAKQHFKIVFSVIPYMNFGTAQTMFSCLDQEQKTFPTYINFSNNFIRKKQLYKTNLSLGFSTNVKQSFRI